MEITNMITAFLNEMKAKSLIRGKKSLFEILLFCILFRCLKCTLTYLFAIFRYYLAHFNSILALKFALVLVSARSK